MASRFINALLLAALLGSAADAAPGLDSRPVNASCLAPARAANAGSVSATWVDTDVGSVAAAGTLSVSGTTLSVRGSGADIYNKADEFHYAYRTLTGDGELVARVTGLTNTNASAKAGVMLRESLTAGSRYAMLFMTPASNGAAFQRRTTTGGSAGPVGANDGVSALPRWVRITRVGNLVSGYLSADGLQWILRDSVTLTALPASVSIGLAVTSHNDGTVATGTFTDVRLTPGNLPAAPALAVEDPFPTAPAFAEPTKLLQAPGDHARWFVLEKTGRVKVFSTATPATVSTWLDFSAKVNATSEGGLLSIAFHPLYPARREVFVAYTTGSPMRLVVSRLLLDDVNAPGTVTEQSLLSIDKPYGNHNGGDLAFAADGYLYISTGDGGGSGDPGNNAQNNTRLLGKMLRIDAYDSTGWPGTRYRIPPDNPWAANARCGGGSNPAACPEIFALGLRNPWRFSIDSATGSLWAGDVGQNDREEINVIARGGNYGWRCREGLSGYNQTGCPAAGLVAPVFDYSHTSGNGSITGGYVYRGKGIPQLRGRYVYGDFLSGRIWALKNDGTGGYQSEQLVDTAAGISSFGQGHDGELYFADHATGRLQRLRGSGTVLADVVPDDLAATGCVDPSNPRQPAPGVLPFSVNAPFWSDGSAKARYLAVPNGATIAVAANGDWQFPAGSVLMKTIELGGKPIETRLLMRHPDGGWAGYTYEWDATASNATRVRGGKVKFISGQDWIYPSEGQCLQCHTTAAGITLGPETGQLNGNHLYPATGRQANQLETLNHIGLLAPAIASPASQRRLPVPTDPDADSLDRRARAYLHANCSNCHRPNGPTGVDMDLRYTPSPGLSSTRTCDQPPQAGDLGITNARLIAPGSPTRSILLQRMVRRDAHGMPPLGSTLADAAGAQLVSTWISQLPACDAGGGGSCHAAGSDF